LKKCVFHPSAFFSTKKQSLKQWRERMRKGLDQRRADIACKADLPAVGIDIDLAGLSLNG
jgi:hypothetical protein